MKARPVAAAEVGVAEDRHAGVDQDRDAQAQRAAARHVKQVDARAAAAGPEDKSGQRREKARAKRPAALRHLALVVTAARNARLPLQHCDDDGRGNGKQQSEAQSVEICMRHGEDAPLSGSGQSLHRIFHFVKYDLQIIFCKFRFLVSD